VEGASAEGIKKTKATLYKMIRSGNFPKPTYMGRSHVLWDIETFISPVLSMLQPGAPLRIASHTVLSVGRFLLRVHTSVHINIDRARRPFGTPRSL